MDAVDGAGTRAVHVLIVGRVQGVGYRAWCADTASALGLSGWVRNLRSGEVEAVICGDETSVETMLRKAGKGPRWAQVREVKVLDEANPVSGPFEVRATA